MWSRVSTSTPPLMRNLSISGLEAGNFVLWWWGHLRDACMISWRRCRRGGGRGGKEGRRLHWQSLFMFAKSFLGAVTTKRMGLCAWFESLFLRAVIRLLQRNRHTQALVNHHLAGYTGQHDWFLLWRLNRHFMASFWYSPGKLLVCWGETKTKPQQSE